MDGDENQSRFASSSSNIPRPKSYLSQPTGLRDITTSANNASGNMMPPPGISHKSSVSSTAPTRKTLVERAGEPRKVHHNSTRSLTSSSKHALRDLSYSSSTSSARPVSSFSQYSHRNSAASSTQAGYRSTPPNRKHSRAQSSIAGRNSSVRPVTSMDIRDADAAGHALGKRNGGNLLFSSSSCSSSSSSSSCFSAPENTLRRGSYDNQMNYTSDWSSSPAAKASLNQSNDPIRNPSLCTALKNLSLNPERPAKNPTQEDNPLCPSNSKLPKPKSPSPAKPTPIVSPSPSLARSPKICFKRSPKRNNQFLTRNSEVRTWDQDATPYHGMDMDAMFGRFKEAFQETSHHSAGLQEALEFYKSRTQEIETKQTELTDTNVNLKIELGTIKNLLATTEKQLQDTTREHDIEIDDLDRRHRNEIETIRQGAQVQLDNLEVRHQDNVSKIKQRFEVELEEERALRQREFNQLNAQSSMEKQRGQMDMDNKDREIQNLNLQMERLAGDLDREREINKELQQNLLTTNNNTMTLESSTRALNARIEFLESGNKEQSDAFGRLDKELSDALAETEAVKEKLRKEETVRRRLHNQVQDLKGNIRVFCRVRPILEAEPTDHVAKIQFPDMDRESREISIQGPEEKSSLGNISTKNHGFSFDHVFGPSSQNMHVFDEISQLVQSALDGYNVCIFCYGQTGSGKTHTMSSEDGMIPRAVRQIYDTATELQEKGWNYTMEGSFIEVYNENINDLLGKAEEFDKKKHEIRHDMQKCQTTITNINTVNLDSPEMVESILHRAATNRSVATTKANERSSRSHSVFILRLIGENPMTGERSEGTLNLVDLAGSERLSHSGSTGERLRETQNINRSLSCLGDVIGALGQGKEGGHIPYRNSKLTYLLQFSLGGNSKTLMFVMVSPRQEHLSESLTSLKFAAKVQNTHIGTAKRQNKIRET